MPDKKLTDKEISTIQRMLGKIESVACVIESIYATPLFDALEVLDSIFDIKEGAENEQQTNR